MEMEPELIYSSSSSSSSSSTCEELLDPQHGYDWTPTYDSKDIKGKGKAQDIFHSTLERPQVFCSSTSDPLSLSLCSQSPAPASTRPHVDPLELEPLNRQDNLEDGHLPTGRQTYQEAAGIPTPTPSTHLETPSASQSSFSEFSLDIRYARATSSHRRSDFLPNMPVLASKNLLRTNPSLESRAKDLQRKMARLRRTTSRIESRS